MTLAVVGAAVVMVFSACPKRYAFDPELDAAATEWRTKIDAFVTSMEERAGTPNGAYQAEANQQFYEDMQKAIGGQIAMTKANSGSPRVVDILESLARDLESLRKLHESAGGSGLTRVLNEEAREALDRDLRALSTLQEAYKNGTEPPAK